MNVTIGDVEREAAVIVVQIASENLVAAIKAVTIPGPAQNHAIDLALMASSTAIESITEARK